MTLRSLLVAGTVLSTPPLAFGQVADVPQPPAHLGVVDGAATLTRDGNVDEAIASVPLVEGDRLRTDDGRLELVLIDGSAIYLDERSELDVQSGTIVRLIEGHATAIVGTASRVNPVIYQLDTPSASIFLEGAGEYRVTTIADARGGAVVDLAVARGIARIETERGSLLVRTGERSSVRDGEAATYPQPFNSARWTPFDRWVRDRQDARTASLSTPYLPTELQTYAGDFDRYGSWGQQPDYGTVWYPTAVGAGWRPYSNGHWQHLGGYGWNWVGREPWGWPTHHFGHWGFNGGTWFWRPGRVWAPARVWWAVSPGFVSWCPLGINGGPVFPFWGHAGFGRPLDPWRGWTVVPRGSFGLRGHVGSIALDGRAVVGDPQAAFVVQRAAPRMPVGARSAIDSRRVFSNRTLGVARAAVPMSPAILGARRGRVPGGTRVESVAPGLAPLYPPPLEQPADAPYRRAERVAAERRPDRGRPPVQPSGAPSVGTSSPYPHQFQTPGLEPFRPSVSRPFWPGPNGSYGPRGDGSSRQPGSAHPARSTRGSVAIPGVVPGPVAPASGARAPGIAPVPHALPPTRTAGRPQGRS